MKRTDNDAAGGTTQTPRTETDAIADILRKRSGFATQPVPSASQYYREYAKRQIDTIANRADYVIHPDGHITLNLEPQRADFVEALTSLQPLDVVKSIREYLEQPSAASYNWQHPSYKVKGETLKQFRRMLSESGENPRLSPSQLNACFDIFTRNVETRLAEFSPQIATPTHIKPHGVEPGHEPVFLMCPPNMAPQDTSNDSHQWSRMFAHASSHIGRFYLWQVMKNAIEAAGGKVQLVNAPPHRHATDRDVFVRDPLIRDTHGIIIRPEWHDGMIELEQPQMLASMQGDKRKKPLVRAVQASIENGNIATDHKRHLLFLSGENEKAAHEDAEALQEKTKSRVIPVVIKHELDDTFYHLDLALTELHPGQFVWCPKAFTRESRALIEKTIPESDRIAVDLPSARKGACNCVTVGKTIITPYASPEMQEQLQDKGYHVETSATLGLPRGALLKFGLGAIHCATFYLGDASTVGRN